MYTLNVTFKTTAQNEWTRSVSMGEKLKFKETRLFNETFESDKAKAPKDWKHSVNVGKKRKFKETQLIKKTFESEATITIQADSSNREETRQEKNTQEENTPFSVGLDVLLATTSSNVFMKRFDALAEALSPRNQAKHPPQKISDYEGIRSEWRRLLRRIEDYNRPSLSEIEMGTAKQLVDRIKAYLTQCEQLLDPTHSLGDIAKKLVELKKISLISQWTAKEGRDTYFIGIAHPESKEGECHDDLVQSPISQEDYNYFKENSNSIERVLRRKLRNKSLTMIEKNQIRKSHVFIHDAMRWAYGNRSYGIRKFWENKVLLKQQNQTDRFFYQNYEQS